jgi:hypothetical protein
MQLRSEERQIFIANKNILTRLHQVLIIVCIETLRGEGEIKDNSIRRYTWRKIYTCNKNREYFLRLIL